MAEVNTGDGGGGGKHQKKRAKKSSTKIDMTPMVDLAFLLLTFFVLTATFSKPKTMEINMPKVDKQDKVEKTKIDDDLAHTVLIGEGQDQIFYYSKKLDTVSGANIVKTDLSPDGLRTIMQSENKKVIEAVTSLKDKYRKKEIKADTTYKRMLREIKGDSLAPFVIVKTLPKSKYKTVIDVIDELSITQISKYTIVDMSDREKDIIEKKFPKK